MTTSSTNSGGVSSSRLPEVGGPFLCALYAATHRPDTIAKVIAVQPDLVILDLEDAVPAEQKHAARELLPQWSDDLAAAGVPFLLRVNPVDSLEFGDDAAAVSSLFATSMAPLDGVLIPKVMSQRDVVTASRAMPDIPIWVMIETPIALALAAAGRFVRTHVAGMVIGIGDLAKHQGVALTAAEFDSDLLRRRIAVAATAARAQQHCLDGVVVGDAGVALEAGRRSYVLGFTGRTVYSSQHVQPCREGGRSGFH